jgi:hypothetical protein
MVEFTLQKDTEFGGIKDRHGRPTLRHNHVVELPFMEKIGNQPSTIGNCPQDLVIIREIPFIALDSCARKVETGIVHQESSRIPAEFGGRIIEHPAKLLVAHDTRPGKVATKRFSEGVWCRHMQDGKLASDVEN